MSIAIHIISYNILKSGIKTQGNQIPPFAPTLVSRPFCLAQVLPEPINIYISASSFSSSSSESESFQGGESSPALDSGVA